MISTHISYLFTIRAGTILAGLLTAGVAAVLAKFSGGIITINKSVLNS